MRKPVFFALLSSATMLLTQPAAAVMPPVEHGAEYVSRTLIVYYDVSHGKEALLEAAKKEGAKVVYDYKIINAVALSVPEKDNIEEAITFFEKVPGVLQVVRDQVQHTMRLQ